MHIVAKFNLFFIFLNLRRGECYTPSMKYMYLYISATKKLGCRASGLSKNKKGKGSSDDKQQSIKDLFSKFAFNKR